MKLKEKFLNIELDDPYIFMCEYNAKECVEIADDYAIQFADWLFLWNQNPIGEWKHQNKNKIINSTKELLEIFKKERGL